MKLSEKVFRKPTISANRELNTLLRSSPKRENSNENVKNSMKLLKSILMRTKEENAKNSRNPLEDTKKKAKTMKKNDFFHQRSEIFPRKREFSQEKSLTINISSKDASFLDENVKKSPNFGNKSQIISNLGNIKVNQFLKSQLNLDNIIENMKVFYEDMEKNPSVSVMSYLSNLFSLFQQFSNQNIELSSLFLLINKLFSLPIKRIIEQFINLRGVYKEKFDISKEKKDFLDEKRKLIELDKVQRKEIQKLKDLLEKGDFTVEKEALLLENSKLQSVIKKQRKELCQQRAKDEKIMRLLNAIRKKGIDLEEIYRETMSSESEDKEDNLVLEPKPPDLNICFSFRKEGLKNPQN